MLTPTDIASTPAIAEPEQDGKAGDSGDPHEFANSKTETVQDLVGIIAAIGFGFALLTLIAGDQVRFTANAPTPNILVSWARFFNVPPPGATTAHSVTNFLLLCVITWRFYFINIRYLANRYGTRHQDERDWINFLWIDVPAIMAEGLVFAALGLLVNNAILFILFLGMGLAIDAFAWNLVCNIGLRTFRTQTRWHRDHPERARNAARKSWWSLGNNGVVALVIAVIGWSAHSMQRSGYYHLQWPVYWGVVLLVVGNCFLSWLVYNKDLAIKSGC